MKIKKYVLIAIQSKQSKMVKKAHKQQYLCKDCLRQFLATKRLNNCKLWQEYTKGKQTYKQLSVKHNLSIKTIQRRLDKVKITKSVITQNQERPHLSYYGHHLLW